MTDKLKHLIFRMYIALARNENFSASDIGETKDFIAPYTGRLIDSYPLTQKNWTENESFRREVCAAQNLTDEQLHAALIVPKPSRIENMFYSSELRRIFGVGNLRFTGLFDKDGYFILPSGKGFIQPRISNGLIESFELVGYGRLRKRAA